MAIDLTFDGVCKSIQDEYPDIVDDINIISDIALTLGVVAAAAPITAVAVTGATAVTPTMIALTAVGTLANLFAVKDKIPQTVERIIDKITSKKDDDPLQQITRMERAYYLICYTAFFEALGREKELIPLLKKIKVKPSEKNSILTGAMNELQSATQVTGDQTVFNNRGNPFIFQIEMPHPGDTLHVECEKLRPLYKQLATSVEYFFSGLTLWESLHESERIKIKVALEKMPGEALKYFEAQYYVLAVKCPPFAKWLNYIESDNARTQLSEIGQKLAILAEIRPQISDIGLQHLSATLESAYKKMTLHQVDKALQELKNKYESTLQSPILDPKDTPIEEGKIALTYPKRTEIFVPQAFKLIHYTGQKQLEPEHIWDNVPERNDLGDFLLSYLINSVSERSPLIILGQPGSGKSLLTSMLAARLLVSSFTPIRVELRNINAEADIKTQITEQIAQVTGRKFDWGILSDHFEQHPGLVLFDGYDELLQASGKVFSAYLRDVEQFQIEQIAMKRSPVRAIVTSRINLIDKADIPPDATIIRLLEFDETKQNYWIDKWNDANASYFQQAGVRSFAIPQNNKEIKELAGQPLLLLMLALYDATDNQLRKTRGLNQTLLYDNLLRQFIERELKKDSGMFKNMDIVERERAIEHQMERFGVAAMGMFNRRALHIHAKQLDADLKFFGFEEALPEGRGRSLSPAEKLFGSFFFVKLEAAHKFSGRKTSSEAQEQDKESDVTYEFLHNTFGEFLTTDFILRKALNKTYSVYKMSDDRYQQPMLRQLMDNPNSDLPGSDWYACLMFAPLFSRPVIINMMQQWLRCCLQQRKKERVDRRDEKEFLKNLDVIIENYLEFVLSKDQLPDIMIGKKTHPFDRFSTPGYLAIYTLNLILLRTMFDPNGYTFVETDETTQKERFPSQDGTRAWDRLTYLWRSWFSLETLNGLATIFTSKRDGEKVYLTMKGTNPSIDRLTQVHNVSNALADNITAGLAGFLLHDSFEDSQTKLDDIRKKLDGEEIKLNAQLFTKQLRHLTPEKNNSWEKIVLLFENQVRRNVRMFENPEAVASSLAEMNRIAQELTDTQGIKIETPDFLDFFTGNGRVSLEEFKLAKTINDFDILGFLIRRYYRNKKNTTRNKKVLETERPVELDVEITKYIREYSWFAQLPVPTAEQFQQYILQSYKGRLPATLAVEMIRLAYEIGNYEVLNYFGQHYYSYLEEMVDPEKSVSVDLAIELIKLVREKGDQDALDYFERYLSRRLNERHEIPSTLAIELIELALETSNWKTLAVFLEEYVPKIITTKNIPIALLIKLLGLAYDSNNQAIIQNLITYCNNMLIGNSYISHELAIVMIQFARKFEDKAILDYFGGNYFRDILQAQLLVPIKLAIELINLTQDGYTHSQTGIESFYQRNICAARCYPDLLSADTLVNLLLLAQKFHDDEMLNKIKQKLNTVENVINP